MPPIPPRAPKRPEQLAINLFDLNRLPPIVRHSLLHGQLDLTGAFQTDKDAPDERGVRFSCELLKAAIICDIIRSEDRKAGDFPTRVYYRKEAGKAWRSLPNDTVLTEEGEKEGSFSLNRKLFPSDEPIVLVPPAPRRVQFGNGDN